MNSTAPQQTKAHLSAGAREEIQIVTPDHPHYPPLLREIKDLPEQLYVRGNTAVLAATNTLAIVGSRRGNHLGRRALELLLPPATLTRLTSVSGLAYGIDAMAHRLSLTHDGPTIAVLGSGVDEMSLYPSRHRLLAQQIIAAGGAVISEYPPGTPGLPGRFPERNRIIAGMCQATLVVQAAHRSGSLITARLALEAGREVWAIPGAITDPLSRGTNLLIQQGATPILQPQDIADLFGIAPALQTPSAQDPALTTDQQKIIACLTHEPKHIDQLSGETTLPAATLSALLLELELANAVQHIGNQKYVKS